MIYFGQQAVDLKAQRGNTHLDAYVYSIYSIYIIYMYVYTRMGLTKNIASNHSHITAWNFRKIPGSGLQLGLGGWPSAGMFDAFGQRGRSGEKMK